MKKNVTFFRRSRAEKESEVNDYSSHPENDSRDDTDTQRSTRVYRKTGYIVPKDVDELRRKLYRKRLEDGDDEEDSESDDSDIDNKGPYDRKRFYSSERRYHNRDNRDRRNGNRHTYNGNDNNRKLHRRTSNLRDTHRDDNNNSSDSEGCSTIPTYKSKVQKKRKVQGNDEKITRKYKDKLLNERLLSDTTLGEFPTRDNGEHTSKKITFSIVGFTKSATSIDSDIVFIPVVVYPRENEERSEISSNYHEETQTNSIPKYENEFVHDNMKDFGNIYQQEPTSLNNKENVSTNDAGKSTPTNSFGNEMTTKGEHQSRLESNNTLIYRVATPGNIFQHEVASVHDVVSQKNEKLDEELSLGVKNETTEQVELFIDKDTHNVYSSTTPTKCLPINESASTLSGNINPILKEPLILNNKVETKPLYHKPYSGYLNEKLKVSELTEPIDTNLEEISKPPTLEGKLEINFKRKPINMQMEKRNSKESTMVNKGDEYNNLRLNKKIEVKEKRESGKENTERSKSKNIPLTDGKDDPKLLEKISTNNKDKTTNKHFHIYKAMYDDYGKTKDVLRQGTLKDTIYGLNGTPKVFGNIPQNETKKYRVEEGYRNYPVTDIKRDKTTSSKRFLSGTKKEDYATERPGFFTTLNCSGDPPIQKPNPMTHITKTEYRERKKKEDTEKSNRSVKLVDKSSPDKNKTIEEDKGERITGMVGRYLMEGCHILLESLWTSNLVKMSERNKAKKESLKDPDIICGGVLDDCSYEPNIRRGTRDKRKHSAPRMKRHNAQEMSRTHKSQTSKEDTYTIIGFICKNEPGTIYIPIVKLRQSHGKRSEASRSEQRQDGNTTIKHHNNPLIFLADLYKQPSILKQDSRLEDKGSEVEKTHRQENINDSKGKNNETLKRNMEKEKETIGKIGGNIMDCCHAFLGTTTHSVIMDGMNTVETVKGNVKDVSERQNGLNVSSEQKFIIDI